MPPRNTKRCISSTKRRRNAWGICSYLFGIHAKTAIRHIGVTKNSFSIMPNGSVKLLICLRIIIINLPCKASLFAHCSFHSGTIQSKCAFPKRTAWNCPIQVRCHYERNRQSCMREKTWHRNRSSYAKQMRD